MDKRRLTRAVSVAFAAQGVTAAVNAFTVLMLAGGLDAAGYGLWQFFLLIGSYAGLFHLGLCDGAYLNNGGVEPQALDASRLGTLFRRATAVQFGVACLSVPAVLWLGGMSGRAWAIALALIYMPIFNADAYLGYILQATGNTVAYSVSVMIDRVGFILLALAAAAGGATDFRVYAVASIVSESVSLVYCVYKTRRLVFAPRASGGVADMARRDISVGSRLMISNLSGQLVTGAARLAVIWRYGDAEFGRISFIMTLSNVFLQLVSQFSMVLFPSLRREDEHIRRRVIERMRSVAGLLLPAVFLAYLPIKLFIGKFLPQYEEGIAYLALLLPLCLFDGKTHLIGDTYFKVKGRSDELMRLNLSSAALSLLLCFGAARLGEDVGAVLIAAVVASAVRSVAFDIRCRQGEGEHIRIVVIQQLSEIALCLAFIFSALLLPDIPALLTYAFCYLVYVYIRRDEFGRLLPAGKSKSV
ncbi:MAG: hypothetical protein IJY27_03265 [Clostridia bacterium]|nr:hypothetical protein [Clostridia bacterium]